MGDLDRDLIQRIDGDPAHRPPQDSSTALERHLGELDLARLPAVDDSIGQIIDALGALAPNTRRAYATSWRRFIDWARSELDLEGDPDPRHVGVDHLTAFGRYLRRQELKSSTISTRLAGVTKVARLFGADLDTSVEFLRNTRRAAIRADQDAGRHLRQATPIERDALAVLVQSLPLDTYHGARDAAVIALGWAAMLRRSEIAALNLDCIEITSDMITVAIQSSKTSDEPQTVTARGRGHTDLVAIVRNWLSHRGDSAGPLFLSLRTQRRLDPGDVQRIIVAAARRPEAIRRAAHLNRLRRLDPDNQQPEIVFDGISGHSLRRGRATDAARHHAQVRALQDAGRWKDPRSALRYVSTMADTDAALGD